MRTRRRKIDSTGPEGSPGNQLLALSLFIMLLAFFIILNAVSTFEDDKSRPVLQSLEAAFASRIAQEVDKQPSLAKSEDTALGEGDVLDRMQALFKAQLPDFDASIDKRRGTMHIEMPWQEFETAIASLVRQERPEAGSRQEYFLSALVALMKNAKAGQPYRMDIFLSLEDNPAYLQNTKPQIILQAGRNLTRVAVAIDKTGLAEKFFSIGVHKGKPGMVEIFFKPHIPFNPLAGTSGHE